MENAFHQPETKRLEKLARGVPAGTVCRFPVGDSVGRIFDCIAVGVLESSHAIGMHVFALTTRFVDILARDSVVKESLPWHERHSSRVTRNYP